MRARNAKRLKELESENGRLKNLLTEAELDVEIGAEGLQSRTVNAPVSWSSRFGVSLRRACNVVGHTDPRNGSTLHRCPTKRLGDESSFETSRAVVLAGGGRVAKEARRASWAVNDERIQGSWRGESLRVSQRRARYQCEESPNRSGRGRRPPAFKRFHNGPDFVENVAADWCRLNGTACVVIDPGSA